MSVALIAFDLDGTLLDNNKNIPPENLRALYAAHEAGILLVPATGRILKGMPEDLMKTGLFRYFIFSNGAIIYDLQKERVIHRAEECEASLCCELGNRCVYGNDVAMF